jgi:hypothetical protein
MNAKVMTLRIVRPAMEQDRGVSVFHALSLSSVLDELSGSDPTKDHI